MGIDNNPTPGHLASLKVLCSRILEPIRKKFKSPVFISSGYRSPELCLEIGSRTSSQHCLGEAVDFEVVGFDNLQVATFIRDNLDFDQLILEHYDGVNPNSGWIHVSYSSKGENRKECLTYDGKIYSKGLNAQ
jgi:hypothetical protein